MKNTRTLSAALVMLALGLAAPQPASAQAPERPESKVSLLGVSWVGASMGPNGKTWEPHKGTEWYEVYLEHDCPDMENRIVSAETIELTGTAGSKVRVVELSHETGVLGGVNDITLSCNGQCPTHGFSLRFVLPKREKPQRLAFRNEEFDLVDRKMKKDGWKKMENPNKCGATVRTP